MFESGASSVLEKGSGKDDKHLNIKCLLQIINRAKIFSKFNTTFSFLIKTGNLSQPSTFATLKVF